MNETGNTSLVVRGAEWQTTMMRPVFIVYSSLDLISN